MRMAINFKKDGETLFRPIIDHDNGDDLKNGIAEAFAAFRKQHPDVSLFDVVTGFEKA
ncbi:hypothetical protein [Hoeflea sp.]|uniref:hypothetical protein n=1 Tax=Hoeflea sp. TaxID=1940281 RepID=UPI0019A7668E|nr:hypothetical protein [Hoeflea sp.]MBC7279924.1 hypothetical protein [Hoeflea sp.]